jgi:hypothetical protein
MGNLSKTCMTYKILTVVLALTWFFCAGLYAQVGEMSGFDLCANGLQTTSIGVSGIDPGKYYALYRNNEMIQVRRTNTEGSERVLSFGTFKDTGIYTAAAFDNVVDGFPSKKGVAVKGKITISQAPVLYMTGDTLRIKSGEVLHYTPKADVPGATFTWTAYVKVGKAVGYSKTGSNDINDTIRAEGDGPACIIFSITPHSVDPIVSCTGEPRDLVVKIRP